MRNFSGIVKKRVPFVPYVHAAETTAKSEHCNNALVGQQSAAPMSFVSSTLAAGHAGQGWTESSDAVALPLSCCFASVNADAGQGGQAGHTFTEEYVLFFEERAAIAEFDGGLSREQAEAQAYAEWQVWKAKQYH